jgi:hypothetical protein
MRKGGPRIFSVSEGHIVLEREEGNALSRLWPITRGWRCGPSLLITAGQGFVIRSCSVLLYVLC